jgi:hypothetical protein
MKLSKVFVLTVFFQSILGIGIAHSATNAHLAQGTVEISCPGSPISGLTEEDEKEKKNAKIPFKNVCFDQKIVASSKVTFFQALKQLFPDLQDDGKATQIRARRSEIKASNLWLNEADQFDLGSNTKYLLFEEENQTQLVLFFEDQGFLALFSIKPHFKFLDFIDVQQDQHSSMMIFLPYDAFSVKPGVWLFPVSNWHDNSSQSYDSNLLFLTLDGKLRLAYNGPNFFGERDPKHDECQNVAGLTELKPLETEHDQFFDISLKLNRARICEIEDKKTGQTTKKTMREKIYPATLYWDPQKRKYMGGSKEFVKDEKTG